MSRPSSGRNEQTLVDELDAVRVGELAQHRGADAAHAEGEAEEQAGDHADPARHQLLRVDHDRREGRGQDQPDDDVSTPVQNRSA